MKYTIYINAHLTKETMHKADTLDIGMIEEVLDNLISWHDIYSEEIPAALDFIRANFVNIKITVAEEYWYSPSYCFTLETMEIKFFPDGKRLENTLVSETHANILYKILTQKYKADALYMDTIIDEIGESGFWMLIKYKKIESCGEFNGRKLYAI